MSVIVNSHITFIDSLQFHNGSLDTLASNLNNEDLKHLTSEFSIDKLEILKRKYAYPYEWVIFLMNNTNTYKMFGINLILILSKNFIIIT